MPTKKTEWHLVPCDGSAHSEPNIDHCGVCAPRWAVVVVPASCANVDAWRCLVDDAKVEGSYASLKRRQKLADTRMRNADFRRRRDERAAYGQSVRNQDDEDQS